MAHVQSSGISKIESESNSPSLTSFEFEGGSILHSAHCVHCIHVSNNGEVSGEVGVTGARIIGAGFGSSVRMDIVIRLYV